MLNNGFVKRAADQTATLLLEHTKLDDRARVSRAYEMVLARPAGEKEAARVLRFIEDHVAAGKLAEGVETQNRTQQAWSRFVQTLFASTEFRMVN